jgi:hypothetical protein
MALETGNYINDLVITSPTSTDPKSQGDDHLRLLKTVLKETLNGFTGAILVTATDTGTATGHVLTPSTALVGYTPMLCLLYKAAVTNTGALTVNVSGLGVRSIKTMAGADPTAGDIVAGYPMLLMYDGTNFVTLGGSEFLSKTGNQKLTGNFTVDGNELVTGTLDVTGKTTLNEAVGLTRTVGDNTTNLATTEFATTSTANEAAVRLAADNLEIANRIAADNLLAPLASPALTGTPTSPTASTGTSTNQIATCAFVTATAFNAALPSQAGNAGKFVTTDGTNASWAELVIPSYLLMAQGII